MTNEENEDKVSHVYLRTEEHGWVPALQLKAHDDGKHATVAVPVFKKEHDMLQCLPRSDKNTRYQENQVVDLTEYPNHVLPMQNVDANGRLEEYKDMVELPFLHEVRVWKGPMKTTTTPMMGRV